MWVSYTRVSRPNEEERDTHVQEKKLKNKY